MDKRLVTIKYKTADGNEICVEVSTSVKELLEQSDRQIRSQRRQDRRHLDFAVLTDEHFRGSLSSAFEDTADLLERMERDAQLYEAINNLTEVQRRRLCRYYFDGLTYRQIAAVEGVSFKSVARSVEQALNAIKKELTP